MRLIEVITKSEKREFVSFPKKLYKGDPYWVCPLDSGLEAIFEPSGNHAFENGEAARWILKDDNNETIGRVAAFIDRIRSAANSQPTGGMGFFEVTENREAAFLLFDTARDWLASRGMEAMDGPVNFGENDNNWGLLVDGFMQQGYGMPYNKKYYRDFFESYGFRNYFEQYSYHRTVRDENGNILEFPERFMKIAEWLSRRPGYSFRHFEFKHADRYVNDIVEIYNTAWSAFKEDFTPLNPHFLEKSLQKAKIIIDEELIWFAYFNEKPIGFFIILPDFNQILKELSGKINPVSIIKFLYFRHTHKMTRARGIAGGVIPSFHNSGVESAIFFHIYQEFKKKPWFSELELSWTGDFNPKMIAIYEALGGVRAKIHVTYRYLINRNLEFKRYRDEMTEVADIKSVKRLEQDSKE